MSRNVCREEHRHEKKKYDDLPYDQGDPGRHGCAGCAYDQGFKAGSALTSKIEVDLDALPFSQAGTVRHRSPHAAWAAGYLAGVRAFYKQREAGRAS